MDTAERIFSLLDKCGMEQKVFANKVGTTASIVSQWRNGISKSYKSYLPQIAEVLGTTVDYLLTGAKKEPTAVSGDGQSEKFMELYHRLSPEKQALILATMKGFQQEN